jgi:hypothetical protein
MRGNYHVLYAMFHRLISLQEHESGAIEPYERDLSYALIMPAGRQ